MTHDPHIRFTPDRLRNLAARGRLMLCGLLAWLAEMFAGARIGRAARAAVRADLLALRRGVAGILILLALPRLAHVRLARELPPRAPRGFRQARRSPSLRFATRLLPRVRSLRSAIAALGAVLDTLDLWIARMADHIAREGDLVAALVMIHAVAGLCATQAYAAPTYADSS